MFQAKFSNFALVAAVFLLGIRAARAADAQFYAVEWSGGSIIDLGGLPGSQESVATGINSAGQVVGYSWVGNIEYAVEWSGGSVINLGLGAASGINDAGQVVGVRRRRSRRRVERRLRDQPRPRVRQRHQRRRASGGGQLPRRHKSRRRVGSGGSLIDLGPGSANAINGAGQVVGNDGADHAAEWSCGTLIELGPGFATAINDGGQVVGVSYLGGFHAVEWSGGSVINLGGLQGSRTDSVAEGINDAGQVVGTVGFWLPPNNYAYDAVEWSGGSVIDLGVLPGSDFRAPPPHRRRTGRGVERQSSS